MGYTTPRAVRLRRKQPESALFDTQRKVVYASNVAGDANAKDGVGFISKISPDGKLIELEWVKGLNAPKGMVMKGDKLYVSDVDQLVEIDIDKGEVSNRWNAEGSKFLNDTVVDAQLVYPQSLRFEHCKIADEHDDD
jgi:hypothetical protein